MVGPLPYTKRHEYPHLSKGEASIWERFIEKYPDRFDLVSYDVELGTPRGFDEKRPEPYASHHRYLGGYKIDVLGEKAGVMTIVELKKQATTKAIGEVDLYEFLYKTYKNPGAEVRLMIITDEEMPHVREWCEEWDVELCVVPTTPTQPASVATTREQSQSQPI